MEREEAIDKLQDLWNEVYNEDSDGYDYAVAIDMAIEALSADATKKKAELRENGDWDCPDGWCDECAHHRSVEWCSLAIPNHEEIDETYKMLNEAFFEGFDAAEKRYRLLVETIEELDKELAEAVEVVRCKDCIHYESDGGALIVCGINDMVVDETDYCSYGERGEL